MLLTLHDLSEGEMSIVEPLTMEQVENQSEGTEMKEEQVMTGH